MGSIGFDCYNVDIWTSSETNILSLKSRILLLKGDITSTFTFEDSLAFIDNVGVAEYETVAV